MTIFDCETGPLPDAELEAVKPQFKAPSNYKDPVKVTAAIAEAEAAWKARAALDAKTARILAIGLLAHGSGPRILVGDEAEMITAFWAVWSTGERMVGFACKNFDMPLLFQRSVILGISPPMDLFQGRYWNRVIDLQEIWVCYGRSIEGQNLDAICKALGVPGKMAGVTGADFARIYAEDRPRALEYLKADLLATAAVAQRLGIS